MRPSLVVFEALMFAHTQVPLGTLQDAALLFTTGAQWALRRCGSLLAGVARHLAPPEHLVIVSDDGGLYSGFLFVYRNVVLTGAVFHAGHQPPRAGYGAYGRGPYFPGHGDVGPAGPLDVDGEDAPWL